MRQSIICAVLAFFLSACSSVSLQQLKQTEITGDTFHTQLATHYRDYATQLEAAQDIANAERFAKKGLKAAAGEETPPENPAEWTLPDAAKAGLISAHDGLVDALTDEMIRGRPEKAAQAQYLYDRWLLRASQNGADAEDYKQRFLTALADLAAPILPTPQTMESAPGISQTNYVVLFDWNSAVIDKEAQATLKRVYDDMLTGYRNVVLNGHTDTSGPADYNMELSLKRAESAEDVLEQFGALKKAMEVFAFGETDPKVKTGDGVKNHTNRRVEIFINR